MLCCLVGAGGKGHLGAMASPSLPPWHGQRAEIPLKPSFEKPCGLWRVAKNIKWKKKKRRLILANLGQTFQSLSLIPVRKRWN